VRIGESSGLCCGWADRRQRRGFKDMHRGTACVGAGFVEKTHAHTLSLSLSISLCFICNVIYSTQRVLFLLIFISVPSRSYSCSFLPSTFLLCMSPAGCACHVLLPCSGLPTPLSRPVLSDTCTIVDMDMSYARMVRTASLTSYPVRCKILHQRTASLS
jgi:hypothetical protein